MCACAVSVGVGIGDAQRRQDFRLQAFHLGRFLVVLVVVALRVQHAVDDQVGGVLFDGFLLLGRFAFQHVGAEDDVGLGGRVVVDFFAFVVGEGQYVGGVVLAAIVAVQGLAFGGVDEAYRQLGRGEQRGRHPAPHFRARDGFLQAGVGILDRQAEFIFCGHF